MGKDRGLKCPSGDKEPKGLQGPRGAEGPIEKDGFYVWSSEKEFSEFYRPLQPIITSDGKCMIPMKEVKEFCKYDNIRIAIDFVNGVKNDETWWSSHLERFTMSPEIKQFPRMYKKLMDIWAERKREAEESWQKIEKKREEK